VPPMAPPAVTPVAVPSGAFVFFSCANSFELSLSGSKTEMSALANPARSSVSTACSARVTLG
jgi:hypothetical protein